MLTTNNKSQLHKNSTTSTTKRHLSDELSFLLNCCQTNPSVEEIEFIHTSLLTINHQSVIKLANQHSILPLVYKTLRKLHENYKDTESESSMTTQYHSELNPESHSFPNHQLFEHLLDDLKSMYSIIARRNILMTAELITLNKEAKARGINLLPFKGPLLAKIAYGDITLRQFSDLDILIARKYFRKFVPTMLDRGYNPYFPIETFSGDKVMFDMNNDCPFYDTDRGLTVEMHWDFFRKLALPTKNFDPWDKTQSITINNYDFNTMSHEKHLLYHSLHGSKHLWDRLGWIVDIDRFIRAIPSLEWETVLKKAEIMGAQKMFLLGVALAIRYFHTPVPQNISNLCKHSGLEPFITYVEAELNSDDSAPEDSLVKLGKVISLRDTAYHKTATLLGFIFQPGINERRTVILSDKMFWLYWLIRPVGMGYRLIFCRLLRLCASST